MANDAGTRKGLITVIVLLIVILVVVFVLWQRDQESQDMEIDINTGDAGMVVEPGPLLARLPPEGIELTVAGLRAAGVVRMDRRGRGRGSRCGSGRRRG